MRRHSICFIFSLLLFASCKKEEITFCESEIICSLSISPGPIIDSSSKLQWNANENGDYSVFIINLFGAIQWESSGQMKKGINELEVPIDALPSGQYILRLMSGESDLNAKILKK